MGARVNDCLPRTLRATVSFVSPTPDHCHPMRCPCRPPGHRQLLKNPAGRVRSFDPASVAFVAAMTVATISSFDIPTRNNSGASLSFRWMSWCGSFQGRSRSHLLQSAITAPSSDGLKGRSSIVILQMHDRNAAQARILSAPIGRCPDVAE